VKSLILGNGGLIGSAVSTELAMGQFRTDKAFRIRWESESQAKSDIVQLINQFQSFVSDDSWAIYWCAGRGHLRSIQSELCGESKFLGSVFDALKQWRNQNGVFTLCSSAGAIWDSQMLGFVDESSPETGQSAYAKEKLLQESLLRAACKEVGFRGVIARLSTIYGPNQDRSKSQGLISRLCDAAVSQRTIDIYVPLETTRNYLFASDAAKMMKEFAEDFLVKHPRSSVATKIFCSRESQSIARLLNVVQLVSGKKPFIIQRKTSISGSYPVHFQIRSRIGTDVAHAESTTILTGVSSVYQDLLTRQQLGALDVYRAVA
jgi:UDP-glucose 4-epimerase